MCQKLTSNKRVHFIGSTKPPTPIPHETPDLDFTLGMKIIFKNGAGKSKHIVYKEATANGLKHVTRHVDGTQSHVDQSHLSLLNQIGFKHILKTSLVYCQEADVGISHEQAQQ